MYDEGGERADGEYAVWHQWLGAGIFLGLLAMLVFASVKLAEVALKFSSPWMSVPLLVLAGLVTIGAFTPVVLLLRRRWKTGRFMPTRAERMRRFEERMNNLEAGKPVGSEAMQWLVLGILVTVVLCVAIPAIALLNNMGAGQLSHGERTLVRSLLIVLFVMPAGVLYQQIRRKLKTGSFRLSKEEVAKIRARLYKPQSLGRRILTVNVMALSVGIFTAQPILDLLRHRAPNPLSWVAAIAWGGIAFMMIVQVFRPAKLLLALPKPAEEIPSPPEEQQGTKNQSFKMIALGVVLPLIVASIFPLVMIGLEHRFAHSPTAQIYPPATEAKADLAAALQSAALSHKRILLDFGVNWCADCQALDRYFHDAKNLPIVEASFVRVRINTDNGISNDCANANQDLAKQYGVPLDKGVPALAVLSDEGDLLYSQKNGEFEGMRHLKSSDLTAFLLRWKP
jgi:hypothetical protein